MTQPLQLPLILLTEFPLLLNWLNPLARCWQHALDGDMVLLVATSDELVPTRYESIEVSASTLAGPRGNTIRGMIFRDLIRKLDAGVNR